MYGKVKKIKPKRKPSINYWKLFKQHVNIFLQEASMHGLIHIVRENRLPIERILWVILVCMGGYWAVEQSMQAWNRYENNAVVITIEKNYYKWIMDFPTVAICLRKTSEDSVAYLKSFKHKYNITAELSEIEEYVNDLLFSTYFTYSSLEKYVNGSKQDIVPTELYLELANNTAAHIPTNPKSENEKKATNTIWPKYKESEYVLTMSEFGICHTFHSKLSNYLAVDAFLKGQPLNKKYEKITKTVKDINLFLNQKRLFNNYMLFVVGSNEIFDITSHPFISKPNSIMVFSLDVTNILSTPQIKILRPAQRNCKFDDETDGLKRIPVYSYKICRVECRINLCLKYCHCTPYYYKRNAGEKICNMSGMYCLSKYPEIVDLIDPETKKDRCPCFQNCDHQEIALETLSNSSWFLDAALTIRFDSLPKQTYLRRLIFSKLDLFCITEQYFNIGFQIGGLFGLFLGCSILSLIEIPYYFTLRLYWSTTGRRQTKA